MTDRLCIHERNALLQPDSLLPAGEVRADPSLVPNERGIYAWWFDQEIRGVPLEGTLTHGNHRLLYIGIAPRAPSVAGSESRSTMRIRIRRNHLGTRVANSTLRLSLACLLKSSLGLEVSRNVNGKAIMSREHEDRLTDWITRHASISVLCHEQAWSLEDALLANGPILPLNIRGARIPFGKYLSALRVSCAA